MELANNIKKTILIYDDNPGVCEFIKAYGEDLNLDIKIANTEEELKEEYGSQIPDIIFYDLLIPGSTYKEGLKFLSQKNCSCPVAIFTGMDNAVANAAFKTGQDLGLNMLKPIKKPINYDELMNAFNLVINNQ